MPSYTQLLYFGRVEAKNKVEPILWDNMYSVKCFKCESAFNQEKALVEAFSVIVKTDGCFAALLKILRELSAVTGH